MQPEQRDEASLWDMREYAHRTLSLIAGVSYESFLNDTARRLAVERSLEIVGEAARRVSPEFREAHPEIAWRQIVGLRNILAHLYASVDPETLWQIATEYVPDLLELLEPLAREPPSGEA